MLLIAGGSLLAVAACAGSTRLDPAPESLRGAWRGDARIIVAWCTQQRLPVSLSIGADGRVEGRIGEALLQQGYVAKNRGDVGRALDIKSDYIVRGALSGTVVPGEPVASTVLFIPFDLRLDEQGRARIEGGVTTSSSSVAVESNFAVCASELVLERSP